MEQTVSAIITTYQREPEIVIRAIKSIINQTCKALEIIIVDDNKNDSEYSEKLVKVVSNIKDVRYIKQDGNKGACAARNLGIENAKGDYIGFLDDDDEWCSEKIEKQLEAFETGVGMVFCNGTIIDENYDPPKQQLYNNNLKQFVSFNDLLIGDRIGSTSNPLILTECIKDCGCFDVSMPARQDYDMWLRISQKYKIKGLDEPLFKHYLHNGEQISKSSHKSIEGYIKLYKKYKDEFKKNDLATRNIYRLISHSAKGSSTFYRLFFGLLARAPIMIRL